MGLTKYSRPRNPTGRNQWAGDRAQRPHGFRLPVELDRVVRAYIEEHGLTPTQFWERLAYAAFAEDTGVLERVTDEPVDLEPVSEPSASEVHDQAHKRYMQRMKRQQEELKTKRGKKPHSTRLGGKKRAFGK